MAVEDEVEQSTDVYPLATAVKEIMIMTSLRMLVSNDALFISALEKRPETKPKSSSLVHQWQDLYNKNHSALM